MCLRMDGFTCVNVDVPMCTAPRSPLLVQLYTGQTEDKKFLYLGGKTEPYLGQRRSRKENLIPEEADSLCPGHMPLPLETELHLRKLVHVHWAVLRIRLMVIYWCTDTHVWKSDLHVLRLLCFPLFTATGLASASSSSWRAEELPRKPDG